jgi:AcrR family transcriptional regulator
MTTRAALAARTHERICDAALAEYRERGISSTSLHAIARRAGVSAATVLNQFGSAEGVAREVVDRLAGTLRLPDDRDWTVRSRDARVRRLVREVFAFWDRSTPWFEMFRAELGDVPVLREVAARFWQSRDELYLRVFGAALQDGRIRGAVFGLTNPATFTALREAGLSVEDAAELVADALVRLLRRSGTAGPSH